MNYTFDSGVIIKGLIKPRRKKQDPLLKEQNRIYEIASSFMDRVYSREANLFIPTVAIIEVACVASRLTGVKSIGVKTAQFIGDIAAGIINERDILKECIDIGATTKISGFDTVFIACAKFTGSALITDDKKMHEAAVKAGVDTKLLRKIE